MTHSRTAELRAESPQTTHGTCRSAEFGNITTLSAADAGGKEASENLTSTFYVDNQLASQTQTGETIGYNLDPIGRTRETVSTGKTSADVINHYASGGAAPAWTVETPSGNWTRNVQGLGGGLAAIQVNGATPVLQLSDLHGDIIATAALSETETKLLSSTEMSEFGVPTTSTPAKYSWLGGEQQPTELPSGVIAMGVRSYVPQLGRFLQTDPAPIGSANAYAYTFGDPVDESDPSGADGMPTWLVEANDREAHELTEAATKRRIEEEERKAAEEAAARAAAAAPPPEAPQLPLGGYEGWEEEYALETGQYEVKVYEGGGANATAAHAGCYPGRNHVWHCPSNPNTGEQCLVYFASATPKIKTCKEILENYQRQTHADNEEAKEWLDVIKCAVKDGFCPDG